MKKAFTAISKSEFENDRPQAKKRNDECSLVLSVLCHIYSLSLRGLNLKMIDWLETHDISAHRGALAAELTFRTPSIISLSINSFKKMAEISLGKFLEINCTIRKSPAKEV